MPSSTTSDDPPWAILESLNPRFSNVKLTRDSQVIGRNRHCQIVFSHTSTISAIHTCVRKANNILDGTLGFVDDLSSNGTYIITDGIHRMIGKGNTAAMKPGDIISLVVIPRLQPNGAYSHKDPRMASDFVAFRISGCTSTHTNMMATPQLHYAEITTPSTTAKRRCLALDSAAEQESLQGKSGKISNGSIQESAPIPLSATESDLMSVDHNISEDTDSRAHGDAANRGSDDAAAVPLSQDQFAEILKDKPGEAFADDYERGAQLGRGAFARVYSARHRRTGLEVAVKQIDKRAWRMRTGRCQPERLLDEVRVQVHI